MDTLLKTAQVLTGDSRIKFLKLLDTESMTVNQVCEMLELKQSTVSKHLSILKNANLVSLQKEGPVHYYSLETKPINHCNLLLLEIVKKLEL